MKSEERRKLKQNELAESLVEIPDFLKKHGSMIITGVLVVIIIVAGFFWLSSLNAASENVQNDLLVESLVSSKKLQQEMIAQVEEGADPLDVTSVDYLNKSKAIVSTFSELGREGVSSERAVSAMLEEAEILMSKLHFSTEDLDETTRDAILDRAEEIYQRIGESAPQNKMASGLAMMGLAMVAENREQWDKAATLYAEIAEDKDRKWVGTPYPLQATIRLPKLDEWRKDIVFSSAPDPVEETQPLLDLSSAEPDEATAGQ
jgi:hypothetical protein